MTAAQGRGDPGLTAQVSSCRLPNEARAPADSGDPAGAGRWSGRRSRTLRGTPTASSAGTRTRTGMAHVLERADRGVGELFVAVGTGAGHRMEHPGQREHDPKWLRRVYGQSDRASTIVCYARRPTTAEHSSQQHVHRIRRAKYRPTYSGLGFVRVESDVGCPVQDSFERRVGFGREVHSEADGARSRTQCGRWPLARC